MRAGSVLELFFCFAFAWMGISYLMLFFMGLKLLDSLTWIDNADNSFFPKISHN